jgi:hypothetical protein
VNTFPLVTDSSPLTVKGVEDTVVRSRLLAGVGAGRPEGTMDAIENMLI